jgi:transglutaminase-like putative cysteine protease/tetratricopeptide (TPR) repeat protein
MSARCVLVPVSLAMVLAASLAAQQRPASDYADQPFVIERNRQTLRYESDGTGVLELFVRVRVQSEAALRTFGELSLPYSSANQTLSVDSVRVFKAGGGSVLVPSTAIQDLNGPIAAEAPMYSDTRMKVVTVPSLRPGDTLQYHVTWTTRTPFAPNQFWETLSFSDDAIVLDQRVTVSVPRATLVHFRGHGIDDPAVADSADRRVWTWRYRNLAIDTAQARERLRARRDHLVEVSTFSGWDELGRWYAGLERDREGLTPAIRARADSLVRGKTSRRDSIAALYDFVATGFRYVSLSFGVGRFQPHLAAEVLANRYGDCKDKHTLFAALLKSIGVASSPVLVSSGTEVDSSVASPGQFDHMITQVIAGSDTLYLDTTPEVGPFGYLVPSLRGALGLVTPLEGRAYLARLPDALPFGQYQHFVADGAVDSPGHVRAALRYTLRGDGEYALRAVFRTLPQDRPDQLAAAFAQRLGFLGTGTALHASDPNDTHAAFSFDFQLQRPDLDWRGRTADLKLPVAPFGLPDVEADSARTTSDSFDLAAAEFRARAQFRVPDAWTVALPAGVQVMREYGQYASSYTFTNHLIVAERVLRLSHGVPRGRAADLATFIRSIRDDEAQQVTLTRPAGSMTAPPAPATNASLDDLHRQGSDALDRHDPLRAASLFRQVVAASPRHLTAWNNLGLALLDLGQLAGATDAFRRQVEINAFDQYAWNNLGRALWRAHQLDEAEAAFRRQIEVVPLDRYAHGNLGELSIEMHHDSVAIAELRTAMSIRPDDPGQKFLLGRAYLAARRVDEAMAMFDLVIEMRPGPTALNNAAYELALANVRLDRAESYARAAIEAVLSQLRRVSADSAGFQQFAATSSLAAYWDTLAWILFQRSDIEPAERYARAAWQLAQRRVIGEHLAAILDRQGQAAEARRIYSLAADGRAVPPAGIGHAPDPDPPASHVAQQAARTGLLALRTVRVPRGPATAASGDVVLLVGPDGRIQEVKFLSGGPALRDVGDALKALPSGGAFPITSPEVLVRRGLVTCGGGRAACSLVYYEAGSAAGMSFQEQRPSP